MSLRRAALLADAQPPNLAIEHIEHVLRVGSVFLSRRWSIVDKFELRLRRFILARRRPLARSALQPLSERERRVVEYAALGHPNKLIAAELDVSIDTIATHVKRAARKLAVSSRVELVGFVWDVHAPTMHELRERAGDGLSAANAGLRRAVRPSVPEMPLGHEAPYVRLSRFVHRRQAYVILSYPAVGRNLETELTIAECEVTASLLRGKSTRRIAGERRTSEQTVAWQVRAIFEKLRVGSRTELACNFAAGAHSLLLA